MLQEAMQLPEPARILLDLASLRRRAEAHLLANPPGVADAGLGPSDFDLNPDTAPRDGGSLTPAAVLVPVVARERLTLLLTERTQHLTTHAGQIAFPGGKIEPGDMGAAAAALREAEEEIGLDPALVEPLGYLPPYRTGTGFVITPLVAIVSPRFTLRPDPAEVADVFEVPFDFLMNADNHRIDSRQWRGAERQFYAMPFEQRYIWGATAGIIRALSRRLFPA